MTSFEHLAMSVAFLAASQLVVGLIVAGYADQAHMTREAERFAGCTPTVLIPTAKCTLRLSDLFKSRHLSRTSFEAVERSFVTRRGLLTWMGAVVIAAFIPRTGDAMEDSAKLKVLFIAGFRPIVRDTGESRKLYRDALGIPFKEEPDGYLHTEAVRRAKSFALWPVPRQNVIRCENGANSSSRTLGTRHRNPTIVLKTSAPTGFHTVCMCIYKGPEFRGEVRSQPLELEVSVLSAERRKMY